MAMLNQGTKMIRLNVVLFVMFLFYSCENKKAMDYESYSKMSVGKSEYNKIYKQASDSIKLWANKDLGNYGGFKEFNRGYLLDSTICFNKSKNKFVGALLINHKEHENATLDDIWFFYGAKVDSIWYFFKGADITLPREMYQKDVTKPLSFEKLHEIALKEVFSGYLKEKEPIVPFWKFWQKQEYEVNEAWFDYHFYVSANDGPCSYFNKKEYLWIDTCAPENREATYNKFYIKLANSKWEP
jgi:hypothetical protein